MPVEVKPVRVPTLVIFGCDAVASVPVMLPVTPRVPPFVDYQKCQSNGCPAAIRRPFDSHPTRIGHPSTRSLATG